MKQNWIKKIVISVIMVMALLTGCIPVYAYVDPDAEVEAGKEEIVEPAVEDPVEKVVEEMKEESKAEEESKEESSPGVLTPEGNLNLEDDVSDEASENLQFMTVRTKDGSVFYIIIDRSANSRNVYFLNEVDTSDLLALMNDEEKDAYEESLEEKEEEEKRPPVVQVQPQEPEPETEPVKTESEKQEKKAGVPVALLLVLAVIAVGVTGGYYFLKIRPAKNGTNIDNMEFEDDEYVDDGPYEEE